MKKIICLTLTLIISIAFLAACNSESDESDGEDGEVTINFLHRWPNEPRKSFYDDKIAEFEEANPNVNIEVNSVLNDSYKERIRVLVSNNDVPDIFSSWSGSFAEDMVTSDTVQPLDEVLEEDTEWSDKFLDSQMSGFTFDDTLYGVPFTVDGKAFFYNTEIFDEHNLEEPQTYDEFIEVLDTLQSEGYETPIVEGLSDSWAISHYMGTIFERVVDPAVIEEDYYGDSPKFTDEGYVEGLEIFKELTGYMGDVSTAMDHEAARNMFGNSEVPIIYLQFAEIKMVEDMGLEEFGFFDFPEVTDGDGNPSTLTGAPEGWMVSNEAPEEAIEFMKFLTSEETAFEFTERDGQLNAIEGAVTEENASPASVAAYDMVMEASDTAPWFDNAVDIDIADIFMRGGQSLANDQTTSEDIMNEVQNNVSN